MPSLRRLLGPSLVFVLVPAACGSALWDLAPQLAPRDLPAVPRGPTLDYAPRPGMAHAALPVFDADRQEFTGPGRIWLKGSLASRTARLEPGGRTVELAPPFFTAVVDAPAPATTVVFANDSGAEHTVHVAAPDAARLNDRAPASALFFGDFQPFVVQDGKVEVNAGEPLHDGSGTTLVAIRKVFAAAARGELPGFRAPAMACGVGDQVYVEGDYHSWGEYGHRHPMSAWTVEAQPRPRVGLAALPQFLDTCYRAHWSFTSFDRALQSCPALMTWDDHDIRDGWGSQGDEHVYRDSWFRGFRDACIAHQFARGPRPWREELASVDQPLWQELAIGGVPTFVLDLRTCRDVAVPTVIGEQQWEALRRWFAALDPARCRNYVLVSSVPLFFRVGSRATIAAAFTDEVRDDLLDTWTSSANEPEWRLVLEEIAAAGARGLRGLIVSGDYHVNALCRVNATRGDGPPEVVAYELMASGLANDSFSDWKQRFARDGWLLEAPIDLGHAQLTTQLRFVEASPSFGALEFDGEQVAASIFQATAEGCFQQRLALSWTEPDGDMAPTTRRIELPAPSR